MSDNDLPDDEFQAKYSGPSKRGGKRPGAGRRRIPVVRHFHIGFRVTLDQANRIAERATADGHSISEYCRRKIVEGA
jgi:hypothetical protein